MRFNPDLTAVVLYNFLNNGQSDARTFNFIASAEGLKNHKNLLMVPGIDAGTVVFYRKFPCFRALLAGNADFCNRFVAIFDGIADKVGKNLVKFCSFCYEL